MVLKLPLYLGGLLALIFHCLSSQAQVIRLNAATDANGNYSVNMIKLALAHIETPYRIEAIPGEMTQARNIEEVAAGNLDVMWAATNQEMEDVLLPVRIPLYKGLLGHRIFIIHRDAQDKFNHLQTLEDLKKITFGQGSTWADAQILAANGLKVVKANKYPSLFYMVDGGRFDAFPRGVQEPWGEIAQRPELALTVEQNLMLVYRMPFYLFVSKENSKLAADLEMELNRAIADGSFDKVFFSDPTVQNVLDKSNLKNRKVFLLENPTLPAATPLHRPELWLDVNQL